MINQFGESAYQPGLLNGSAPGQSYQPSFGSANRYAGVGLSSNIGVGLKDYPVFDNATQKWISKNSKKPWTGKIPSEYGGGAGGMYAYQGSADKNDPKVQSFIKMMGGKDLESDPTTGQPYVDSRYKSVSVVKNPDVLAAEQSQLATATKNAAADDRTFQDLMADARKDYGAAREVNDTAKGLLAGDLAKLDPTKTVNDLQKATETYNQSADAYKNNLATSTADQIGRENTNLNHFNAGQDDLTNRYVTAQNAMNSGLQDSTADQIAKENDLLGKFNAGQDDLASRYGAAQTSYNDSLTKSTEDKIAAENAARVKQKAAMDALAASITKNVTDRSTGAAKNFLFHSGSLGDSSDVANVFSKNLTRGLSESLLPLEYQYGQEGVALAGRQGDARYGTASQIGQGNLAGITNYYTPQNQNRYGINAGVAANQGNLQRGVTTQVGNNITSGITSYLTPNSLNRYNVNSGVINNQGNLQRVTAGQSFGADQSIYGANTQLATQSRQLFMQTVGMGLAETQQYLRGLGVPAQLIQAVIQAKQAHAQGNSALLNQLLGIEQGSQYQGLFDTQGVNISQPQGFSASMPSISSNGSGYGNRYAPAMGAQPTGGSGILPGDPNGRGSYTALPQWAVDQRIGEGVPILPGQGTPTATNAYGNYYVNSGGDQMMPQRTPAQLAAYNEVTNRYQ
jgi:hypothetical protein